jgi:hypothetical protein
VNVRSAPDLTLFLHRLDLKSVFDDFSHQLSHISPRRTYLSELFLAKDHLSLEFVSLFVALTLLADDDLEFLRDILAFDENYEGQLAHLNDSPVEHHVLFWIPLELKSRGFFHEGLFKVGNQLWKLLEEGVGVFEGYVE